MDFDSNQAMIDDVNYGVHFEDTDDGMIMMIYW